MERIDHISEEGAEAGKSKEEKITGLSSDTGIDEIVKEILKSGQNFSNKFSETILKFIKSEEFSRPKYEFTLYELFEQFNQSLIRNRLLSGGKAGSDSSEPSHLEIDSDPPKPSHFEIEPDLIEELIRKAVGNLEILKFIYSSRWNDLRVEFCNKVEINYQCIESLENLIMFQDLMQKKREKYKLNRGW